MKVLIIADDLTGALDAAVAFVRPGRTVRVARRVENLSEVAGSGADVVCVNTSSREGTEAAAISRVMAVAEIVDPSSVPILMKKVDSRLKGHVGAETKALAKLAGRTRVVAAPAIPDMGRLQEVGVVFGSGIAAPIKLVDRFDTGVCVPDIRTEGDLASAVAALDDQTLWAGARGLAFALAEAAFGAAEIEQTELQVPLLIALGSRDPITLAQVRALNGICSLRQAPNGSVPDVTDIPAKIVVAMSPGDKEVDPADAGASFAEGMARLATRMKPRSLLVSGGETADLLLDRLGIGVLTVLAEVAPGLPICCAAAPWGPLLVATKSGGFGPPELLCRLVARAGLQGDPSN